MSFEEGLGGLRRKGLHKAVVRMRQIEDHVVRLALDAGDYHHRFAEVGLRLARRMGQRDEHLPAAQLAGAHVVLHDRVAAGVTVLGTQPVEDTLGGVPLLARTPLVVF